MKNQVFLLSFLVFLFMAFHSKAQTVKEKADDSCINRKAKVAGQFYTNDPKQLRTQLEGFFYNAVKRGDEGTLKALIAPHAGYVFSGQVAASAYNQIPKDARYDNIFILAPSHRVQLEGASIYSKGHYETPLGEVKVNRKLAEELIQNNSFFQFKEQAHEQEHSLEVQLPFLQYHVEKEVPIVPIVVGTHDPEVCRKMAAALKPYFEGNNLFVVSTDFSHYPKARVAKEVDQATANAVISNSPEQFMETIHAHAQKKVPNLVTSMCGWPCTLTLLYLTSEKEQMTARLLQYMNSGDLSRQKDRVVGYWAIGFYRKEQKMRSTMDFDLNEAEKRQLLEIARMTLETYIPGGEYPDLNVSELSEILKTKTGAFVTLHVNEKLRGCIGRFNPDIPLYEVVQQMAVAAATRDVRFPNIEPAELGDLEIEISVLTPMEKIDSPQEIILGEDGVYIKKGPYTGTFLPQVAEKTNWTKEEFLGHCARDKAGIGWEGWKDADLFKYQAIVFKENR